MRKIIASFLLLSLCLILFGCSGNNNEQPPDTEEIPLQTSSTTKPTIPHTTEPETEPPQTYPKTGVYGDTIVLGNITFAIPDDFIVTVVDKNSFVLSPSDGNGNCAIAIAAFDVSLLEESSMETYLDTVNKAMVDFGDDIVVPSEDDIITEIGGIEVHLRACGTSDGSNMIFHADGTFTDSWYAYTIVYKSNMESEKHSEYNNIFVAFTLSSTHNGREPRFDFVQ